MANKPFIHPAPRRWPSALYFAAPLAALIARIVLPSYGCAGLVDRTTRMPIEMFAGLIIQLAATAFAVLGALIHRRQPGNPIGPIYGWGSASLLAFTLMVDLIQCGAGGPAAGSVIGWIANLTLPAPFLLLFFYPPLLFPTGKYLSNGWRAFAAAITVLITAMILFSSILPGPLGPLQVMGGASASSPISALFNPLPVSGRQIGELFLGTMVLGMAAANLSLIFRWRQSSGEALQQLKWFAYYLATVGFAHVLIVEGLGYLLFPQIFESWLYPVIVTVSLMGYPVVTGLAILRYRLYDIDIIIRKTVMYALLTGMLAAIYYAIVLILQRLFIALTGNTSLLAVMLSTLAIAALFQPMRRPLQSALDRRFYRQRYDAEQTLQSFRAELRSEIDLEQIEDILIAVTEQTMQPASMSLWRITTPSSPATGIYENAPEGITP